MVITLASYLLVGVFCVIVGIVLDRMVLRPQVAIVPAAEDDSSSQLAREVLKRVQGVTERIMLDVNSHSAAVRDVDDQLNTLDVGRDGIDSVVQLVEQLVASNTSIQEKLSEAESKLDELSQQIAKNHVEARTDTLTGCANRRAFDEELAQRVEAIRTSGASFAIVMIDIDHFKQVNDTHGHHVGDSVLRMVGRTLRHHVRKSDMVARYGGEEFAVIMPTATVKDACRAAEALRHEVERLSVPLPEGSLRVTISAGAAESDKGGAAVDPVQRADAALYAAKRAGRNRVYLHDGNDVRPAFDTPETVETEVARVEPEAVGDESAAGDDPRAAAIFDSLPTKTAFCQEVRRRIAEWNRGGRAVSIALISLENWREIETVHGPHGSYRALSAVAAALKDEIRDMDLLARYGGSMFGLLLPTADEQSALVIGERLRNAVQNRSITISGETVKLRIACGTAQVAPGDEDAVPLLRRAEQVLDGQRDHLRVVGGATA